MKSKVMAYETVEAATSVKLDEEVKKRLEQGFEPYGNPYFVPYRNGTGLMVLQAMVKYDPAHE